MNTIRSRFPIFENKVYLNSCSQGALSAEVRQSYEAYMRDWDEKGSPWEYWVERMEAARHAFAGLVNAEPNEVAVTTSVSAGVSTLASAFDFTGERNKIVVSDFEFPTVAQVWHAQEARGAKIVHVPSAGNIIPVQRFADAIDERTKLVSITHICFRNGSKLDIPVIVELAHKKGALVLLDSYQALGTMPVDVKALKVDFLAGGVLKYLLGSAGLAYLPDSVAQSDGDWLVLAGQHLCDGHLPARPPPYRAPFRVRHAAGAQYLCRRGRHQAHPIYWPGENRAAYPRPDGRD
jgi:selenocysteine lyase/cysteine desulfurase